jgi:hypothetical protein
MPAAAERGSDDRGPFCFFPYCVEKMRAMVPAITAAAVTPSQKYRRMKGVIMVFTVTAFPSL